MQTGVQVERQTLEEVGLGEALGLGFAVAAGGMGERLGYSGIKLDLPAEVRGAINRPYTSAA